MAVAGTPGTRAKRRGSPLRALAGALLVLFLLLVAAVVGAAWLAQGRLDQDALRIRIERQVLRDTGRVLTIRRLHVRLLPVPLVEADGIALADWPDGTRPQMLTVAHATAHPALLPLIRHVVRLDGMTLVDPVLVLERHADGQANWMPHRPDRTGTAPGAASPPGGGNGGGDGAASPWRVRIGSLRLVNATLDWNDARSGATGAVVLDRAAATGLAGASPELGFAGRRNGVGFDGQLRIGALARLVPGDTTRTPWPVFLAVRLNRNNRDAGRLQVTGHVSDPAAGQGFDLVAAARIGTLDALDAVFPHAGLPAVADVALDARLVDDGTPRLASLRLRTGAFAAGPVVPSRWLRGLDVSSLELDAASADAPLRVSLKGRLQGRVVALDGRAGTLAGWQAGAQAVPVDLAVVLDTARLRAVGTAGRDAADLKLSLQAPSSRAILPTGPELDELTAAARLTLNPDRSWALSDATVHSRQLDFTGQGSLKPGEPPVLAATIRADHADLDALARGWGWGDATGRTPAAASPAATKPESGAPATGPVVPFDALRLLDARIGLDARTVIYRAVPYRALHADLVLADGVLRLAPLTTTGPAGPIDATFAADARDTAVALTLKPAILPAAGWAGLIGHPLPVSGDVEVVADLHGTGATVPALLQSLSGTAGASVVNGAVEGAALAAFTGRAAGNGSIGLRCLALPAQVASGAAILTGIVLQTDRLEIGGHGRVALADGRLDLHLLPRLSIGAMGNASLPVRLGGTLVRPSAALDPAAPGGRFALVIGPAAAAADPCAAALLAARFGVPGPQPAAAASPARKLPRPIDLLRGLGLLR